MKITQTGGTLNSSTLEEYLYGLIKFGQSQERQAAHNPQNLNYISSVQSDDALSLTISVNFPFVPTIVNGPFTGILNDYLIGVTFNPGSGTLKSDNWVGQIAEAIVLLDNAQASPTSNPAGASPVGGYNFASPSSSGTTSGVFTASVTLKLAEVLNSSCSTTAVAVESF